MEIISRKQAKKIGLTYYFTGRACKHGHVARRNILNKTCLECAKIVQHDNYVNNKEKHNKRTKIYYENNKEHLLKCSKEYAKTNRVTLNETKRKYHQNRIKTDIEYHLKQKLRNRFWAAIRYGCKKGSAVHDLGCSIPEFIKYFESLFQPGMSWDNRGEWHIDHIKPLSAFDLTDRNQVIEACHYTNLQPLWAKDNLSKGDKLPSQMAPVNVHSSHTF